MPVTTYKFKVNHNDKLIVGLLESSQSQKYLLIELIDLVQNINSSVADITAEYNFLLKKGFNSILLLAVLTGKIHYEKTETDEITQRLAMFEKRLANRTTDIQKALDGLDEWLCRHHREWGPMSPKEYDQVSSVREKAFKILRDKQDAARIAMNKIFAE